MNYKQVNKTRFLLYSLLCLFLLFAIYKQSFFKQSFSKFYKPEEKAEKSGIRPELSESIEHGNMVFRYGIEKYTDDNRENYGKIPGLLIAIDKSTGQNKWVFKPKTRVFQPVIDYDVVLVRTTAGQLYTLDRETGKILWEKDVDAIEYFEAFDLGMKESYYYFGSLLIVPSELSAYSKRTGELAWSFKDDVNKEFTLENIDSLRMVFFAKDGNGNVSVLAIETSTGTLMWEHKLGNYETTRSVDLKHESLILMAENKNRVLIQKINLKSGVNIWKREYGKDDLIVTDDPNCHPRAGASSNNNIITLTLGLYCPDPGSYAENESQTRILQISAFDGKDM